MGCYGQNENGPFYIRKTPALNRFLFYLQSCISDKEIEPDGLSEIKLLMPVTEKYLFHLTLSAYLDDAELLEVLSSEKNEEFFSNLTMILDDEEMEKIDVMMYVNLVLELELIEDCVCMISADPSMKIMKNISEVLTRQLIKKEFTKTIDSNMFQAILVNFVKLSQAKQIGQSYYTCVVELLNYYLNQSSLDIGQSEKMLTLIRLISVSLLQEEDYRNNDEICVLLSEWEVDKSTMLTKSPSTNLFKTLFCRNSDSVVQNRSENLILKTLDGLLSLVMGKQDESFNRLIIVASQTMTLSCYLGCCAYLIQILSERHRDTVNVEDFPNTLKYIENFVQEKPKMKQNEAVGENQNFYKFCETMNQHSHRDIYKRDWIVKFLTFSEDEVVGSPEGQLIAETFIVNADHDMVLEYAKKVCAINNTALDEDESGKELILKILINKQKSRQEVEDLVNVLFNNGSNGKLALAKFKTDLHIINLKLGNIEFEKEMSKQLSDEYAVIRICLQNPDVAVTKILTQSIRTEHFRALGFARPFFLLTAPMPEEREDTNFPSFLIVNCFSKFIKSLPGYPNSLYDSLCNSIEIFISQTILTERNIYLVLKHHILKKLVTNRVELAVVRGLVYVLENLIRLITDQDLVKEILVFVVTLKRFFSLFTNPTTFLEAVQLKSVLCRIIKCLSTDVSKHEVSCDMNETVEDFNLFDQGVLYVRCSQFRSLIKKLLNTGNDELGFKDFVQNCTLPWVVNCNEEEWSFLIDFIFNVTMSETSKFYRVKNINKMYFLNELLLLTYAWNVESKCTEEFLHVFRFYGAAVETVKHQFTEMEWYSLFDSSLRICAEMTKVCRQKKGKSFQLREVVGMHQILSYLLNKVEDLSNGDNSISVLKWKQLLVKIDNLPQLDTKSEPVRWLISEKIKKIQSVCPLDSTA